MPYNAPEETKLQVHKHVIETLARLNPSESRRVIEQLVEAATEKALKPWRRQQEIQKIIGDALPLSIKYTDYLPRAQKAAAEAVSELRLSATREELEFAAKEAIQPFIAQEEHDRQCNRIMSGISLRLWGETSEERELAKEAVSKALQQLPVGCSEKRIERARDQALVPIKEAIASREEEARCKRQAEEAVKRADTRLIWTLGHVDSYLRELNESKTGIGHFLQSWALAEKYKKAIRPILVKELVEKPNLTDEQIHERIEWLVDEQLEEEIDEELEVDEAVEDRR